MTEKVTERIRGKKSQKNKSDRKSNRKMERFWPNLKKIRIFGARFLFKVNKHKERHCGERERERSFFSTLGLLSLGLV